MGQAASTCCSGGEKQAGESLEISQKPIPYDSAEGEFKPNLSEAKYTEKVYPVGKYQVQFWLDFHIVRMSSSRRSSLLGFCRKLCFWATLQCIRVACACHFVWKNRIFNILSNYQGQMLKGKRCGEGVCNYNAGPISQKKTVSLWTCDAENVSEKYLSCYTWCKTVGF